MASSRNVVACSLVLGLVGVAFARPVDVADAAAPLQALKLPASLSGEIQVTVELGGQAEVLVLRPNTVRASNFRLLVQDESGTFQAVEPPSCTTLRGTVAGLPDSVVAGSLDARGLRAMVRLAPGTPEWSIEPAAGAHAGQHAVEQIAGTVAPDFVCGFVDTDNVDGPAALDSPSRMPTTLKTCELALDADHDYYVANGSDESATVLEMESIINVVDAIYTADVSVTYAVGTIIVRTSSNDPYTAVDIVALLNQVEHEWNAYQCSVARDVVQMFTHAGIPSLIGGNARGNQLCNLDRAYSFVKPFKYSTLTMRAAASAHELGHNWGAGHCDSGPCASTCGIMDMTLGGPGSLSSFDACSIAEISQKVAAVTCLDATTPNPDITIDSLCQNPTGTCVNDPTTILPLPTIYLKGSGVTGATSLTMGGSLTVPESGVAINYVNQLVSLSVLPPALGVNTVEVTNSCGTSNAASIQFIEPTIPVLDVEHLVVVGGAPPYEWKWAAKSNHNYYLLAAAHPASTYQQNGWTILSGATMVAVGQLTSIGYGSHSITIPTGYGGTSFDIQVVTTASGQGVTGSSSILQIQIIL